MNVVSNTSPLCYALLIGQIDVFPALYGAIMIPETVRDELLDKNAPDSVRQWMESPPDWVSVLPVVDTRDFALRRLHQGEKDAILLAEEMSADLLLLDEKAARNIAVKRGLTVTGLLGILEHAARESIIEIAPVLRRLNKTSFRIHPHLLKKVLEKHYP